MFPTKHDCPCCRCTEPLDPEWAAALDGHAPDEEQQMRMASEQDQYPRDELDGLVKRLTALRDHIANLDSGSADAATLTDALTALRSGPVGEWQPIETAPKHEIEILVWAPGWRYPHNATWCEGPDDGEGSWENPFTSDFMDPPTHWMHLPSTRALSQREGEGNDG